VGVSGSGRKNGFTLAAGSAGFQLKIVVNQRDKLKSKRISAAKKTGLIFFNPQQYRLTC
jgi:hypothetical protein